MPKPNISPIQPPILNKFLDHLAHLHHRSPQTIHAYRRDLLAYFSFVSARDTIDWAAINRQSCRDYVAHLTLQKQLSGRSISRHISSLRTFWRFLMEKGMVQRNIWQDIRLPKFDKTLPRYLESADIYRVLDHMPLHDPVDFRDKLILELLFVSGMRVSELVGLTTDQLDIAQTEIIIQGKGDKYRYVFFGPDTAALITAYLPHRFTPKGTDHRILITNQKGGPMSARSIQRLLVRLGDTYSLPTRLTPHVLRHSFASALYKNGADLKVIQDLLGHDHITTTQVYTHLSFSQLKSIYHTAHPRAQKERPI